MATRRHLVRAASGGALLAKWRSRYRAWHGLGPGGLPRNPAGWLVSETLRLASHETVSTERYFPGPRVNGPAPEVPARPGPRPRLGSWPIPHRQLDQLAGDAARVHLFEMFDATLRRHSASVVYRRSHFEAHHDAITLLAQDGMPQRLRRGHGELAHIHPSDGSMHMVLDPPTAVAVIEAGWGERHPLAGIGKWLPATYLLIYAPRDDREITIVEQILTACIQSSL